MGHPSTFFSHNFLIFFKVSCKVSSLDNPTQRAPSSQSLYPSSLQLLRFCKELNRKAKLITCLIPMQIAGAMERFYLRSASLHTLHNPEAAQRSGSTSGLKPDFKMESSSPGPQPNSGCVAWDKSLNSFQHPVSLLGCEAGMVCKAFPTLKLNDVCLFLERLSGSSWTNGKTSALPQGWRDRKAFLKLSSPLWTWGIITTLHIRGTHAECMNRI